MCFFIIYSYFGFYFDYYLIMDDYVDVNKFEIGNYFLFKRFNIKFLFFKYYQIIYYKKKKLNIYEFCIKLIEFQDMYMY